MITLIAPLFGTFIACGIPESLHLQDDVGPDDDSIHSPYARGAVVSLSAGGWGHGQVDDSWSIVPDDEGVLVQVEPQQPPEDEDEDEGFGLDFRAVGQGTTAVSLVDEDGDVRARTTVEVVMPDSITLHGATAERSGLPELAREDCEVSIVQGGTGGLIAQYWLGDVEVFGNGVLSLLSADPVVLDVDYSYSGKDLDWLQLSPEEVGSHTVDLLVDGVALDAVTYEAVPYEGIVTTALLGGDESGAEEGDWIELLVQSFDANDCPVLGAAWTWHVDGELQEERGDLYRYELDEDVTTSLEAQFGDHVRTTSVHGVGTVMDSNAAGCSAVAGSAALAPAMIGLLALARRRDD